MDHFLFALIKCMFKRTELSYHLLQKEILGILIFVAEISFTNAKINSTIKFDLLERKKKAYIELDSFLTVIV